MTRIYIAGCGGMLGEAFHQQFVSDYELKCTDKDVNEDWLTYLDFRDRDAYRADVEAYSPEFLFHLGAYTDLEYCEEHPDDAYVTNTLAVEDAVHIANDLDIPILYVSTAGIFDGRKSAYDDWDQPNPLGVYARTKYMAERFVVQSARRHLVCRAGWMMGAGPRKDKKFVQKLMRQIKDGARELYVVNDKDGTPTYTHDFAKTVKALVRAECWGLYNTVCGGQTSRLEVAEELVRLLNLEERIRIIPVGSDHFKSVYYAQRPPSERLVTKKLELRGLSAMRDWKTSLKEYLEAYYHDYL